MKELKITILIIAIKRCISVINSIIIKLNNGYYVPNKDSNYFLNLIQRFEDIERELNG
jgi:hypothetical protein